MTGHDFIALAGRLATMRDEASLRTSVSRSYYGAFHVTLAFLREIGCGVTTNSHAEPTQRLSESNNVHLRQAGHKLSDLRGSRIAADYKLDESIAISAGIARQCVEAAHEICRELEKCDTPETRAEIKAAIDAYLAKRDRR